LFTVDLFHGTSFHGSGGNQKIVDSVESGYPELKLFDSFE